MDTLRFYFVTWNVATKSPTNDLNLLLGFPSQYDKRYPLPDFYVIGFQEVKSQPQNLIMDSLFSDPWTSVINNVLCRQGFISAKSIRLQGIILLVYTQMKHLTHLRDIEAQYTKTGLGGMWGNKGAVSIRFNIYGCSVCLVNCHLTAHEHLLADRINDYNTIIKQHTYHVGETTNILFHDYVFWIGDLNFRTDHPTGNCPSSEEIIVELEKIEDNKYSGLLKHDQLLAVMETGEAFSEFTEPEIRFPPSYKFLSDSSNYDVKRKPSWTDRVLYKVNAHNYENVTLRADVTSYDSLSHYTTSDHKPVIAKINIKVRSGFTLSVLSESPRVARSAIRMRRAIVHPSEMHGTELISGRSATLNDGPVDAEGIHESTIDEPIRFIDSVDSQDDAEMAEAFSNYTEKIVEFAPVSGVWYIGDADFRTQCTLSPDVVVNPNDWIGIYDANLRSLDEYIAYEYLAKVSLPPLGPDTGAETSVEAGAEAETEAGAEAGAVAEAGAGAGQPRTITLSFPVGSGVRTPGFYRFIYMSQPSSEVRSVLGISEPFEVSNKEDRLVSVDEYDEPSSREARFQDKPKSTTADIFKDFAGLDVANLSRHFSNDLSID